MPDVLKRYSEGTDEPRSRLILYWEKGTALIP
jgi:hypothetical protein